MNDNGKGNGQPREGNRKPQSRQGASRHGGPARVQHQGPQGRSQRDPATLGMRKEEPKKPSPPVDCVLCGKPIFDLSGALADRDTGTPAHFDCVLEKVSSEEKIEAREKIVYLGAGCFAVVEFKNGSDGPFTVKRRIRWEKEGEKQAWRKELSSYITRI